MFKKVTIMGILNVTPDSFSDGGRYMDPEQALRHALQMIDEGAHIIDVGGESTRPGAKEISIQEELDRVIPIIEKISQACDNLISIDTSKAEVMRQAVKAGAGMINDVHALQKPDALEAAAECNVPVCLMHMQNAPDTMQLQPSYHNVVTEVYDFLQQRMTIATQAGIDPQHIIVDPGFGFGKTVSHNLQLVAHLNYFSTLHAPILLGVSRKSTIGSLLSRTVEERLPGSLALSALAVYNGATIIRTHDVSQSVDVVKMMQEVLKEQTSWLCKKDILEQTVFEEKPENH